MPYRQPGTYSGRSAVDTHAYCEFDMLHIHPHHPAAAVLPLTENTHYNNPHYHHHTAVHYAQAAIVAAGQSLVHHYHMEGHRVASDGEEAGSPTVGPVVEDLGTRSCLGLDLGLRIHIDVVVVAPGSGREG